MSCKHPMKGFIIGEHPSGKPNYYIADYSVNHVEKHKGKIVPSYSTFVSPYATSVYREYIDVPCGVCSSCRLAKSKTWADRLMLELQDHEDAWFVTLTYNDEHLPKNLYADSKEQIENVISNLDTKDYTKDVAFEFLRKTKGISSTLCVKDVQNFMKRLRKAYNKKYPGEKLRFFCAGEYGEKFGRPHYHLIIFGLHLDDVVPSCKSKLGYQYYESKFLDNAWSIFHPKMDEKDAYYEPIGMVVLGKVTWETCAYTARYIMKKQFGTDSKKYYESLGIIPEFTLQSRRPGIARGYYDENKDNIYKFDYFTISTDSGGRKIRPPAYYDKLFEIEHPKSMEIIKEHRKKLAIQYKANKMNNTSLDYLDQLQVEENALSNKIQKLKRSVE